MRKAVINIALFCGIMLFAVNSGRAQLKKPGIMIGGNLLYATPKGDFGAQYTFGGGGELYGGIGIGKTFATATTGFSAFKPHSGIHTGTLTYVPVKFGLRQFVFRKLAFINADLGRATVKNKTVSQSRFTRGIGAGLKLAGIEAAIYYDGWRSIDARGYSNSLLLKFGWNLSL